MISRTRKDIENFKIYSNGGPQGENQLFLGCVFSGNHHTTIYMKAIYSFFN